MESTRVDAMSAFPKTFRLPINHAESEMQAATPHGSHREC